jgi:hypothetical protein
MMSDLDLVLKAVIDSAHRAAMSGTHDTAADVIRAAVRAAFECAIANGLIEVKPAEEWPELVVMDPPYRLPWERQGADTS